MCWQSCSPSVPKTFREQAEHDRGPAETTVKTPTFALVLGCSLVALDAVLFVALNTERLAWLPAVGAHVALCVGLAIPGLRNARRSSPGVEWQEAMLQLAVWTALLGPFGAIIGMTLLLPRAGMGSAAATADTATATAERHAKPSRLQTLHNTLLDGRLRLDGAHAVRPLFDIIIEGTPTERLEALGLIAKHYDPAFAPALKRALQDTDTSVRVLAATVMAQLHNKHTKQIGTLQDAALAASDPVAWRMLGEARLAYAASGLLEPDRAKREVDEAHACQARASSSALPAHPVRDAAVRHSAPEALFHAA